MEYWELLTSELQAFLHHCSTVKAPSGSEDCRFGIRAFHHPALVMALGEQAPEVVLLELADLELWDDPTVAGGGRDGASIWRRRCERAAPGPRPSPASFGLESRLRDFSRSPDEESAGSGRSCP